MPDSTKAHSDPAYIRPLLISFTTICSLIVLIFAIVWSIRCYHRRGFHLRDLRRLSKEVRRFEEETEEFKNYVKEMEAHWRGTGVGNYPPDDEAAKRDRHGSVVYERDFKTEQALEILTSAMQWETGMRIALGAWEDITQRKHERVLRWCPWARWQRKRRAGRADDLESRRVQREMRESHGRYIVGLMRAKCIDAAERRREMAVLLSKEAWESEEMEVDIGPPTRRTVV